MIRLVFVFNLLFAIVVGGASPRTRSQPQTKTADFQSDAMLTLSRGGLIVRIPADVRVLVDGQTFDFDIGAIKTRISHEELQKLIDGFDRIDFFSLRDQYRDAADGCSSDGRTYCVESRQTTSLTVKGKSKSVTRWPYECLEKDGFPRPRELV